VDGNQYDQRCLEVGDAIAEEPSLADGCALLLNNKATPLIVSGSGATHNSDNRVVVSLVKGTAVLPELQITDSSEALLSGRKPPFRLVVRAGGGAGRIRHAVSEGFVVATRRTRTAGKVEIPNVDDHISKLEHMGKETVKKLQDIRGSARASGIDIQVPDNCINKGIY
jgi:Calmodulin binding protein-like